MNNNKHMFDGLYLFYSVVNANGFSAAARALGHTPSHVSKEIARLETRLGVRLLNRTTRTISLTESGRTYFENARRIIEDTRSVEEHLVALGNKPFGELRMSVPVIFAHHCLNAWLPEFLQRYPDIDLDIDVSERHADMIAEGIDLLVRISDLPSSDMIARELFETERLTVAAPSYLTRMGEPEHPRELQQHRVIEFTQHQLAQIWNYTGPDGETISVPIQTRIRCNDARTEQALAIAGCGITRLPGIVCQQQLHSGELVRVLNQYEPPPVPVSLIYPSRLHLPAKTRAMIDFLIEKCG